jgi:hypothetical protein
VPANARIALDAIAELKGLPLEAVARAVAENTRCLLGDLDRFALPRNEVR